MPTSPTPPKSTVESAAHRFGAEVDQWGKFITRLGRARREGQAFGRWLLQSTAPDRQLQGKAVYWCSRELLTAESVETGRRRVVQVRSCQKHLLCQSCAILRGLQRVKGISQRFQEIQTSQVEFRWQLVTLTVANTGDLAERVAHLRRAYELLEQRRRDVKRGKVAASAGWDQALGGVGAIEVKRGARSGLWHPHMHLIVASEAGIDESVLRDQWLDKTTDSHIVNVTDIDSQDPETLGGAIAEISKYALKIASLQHGDRWHAFNVLRGQRLAWSFGLWRRSGCKTEDDSEGLDPVVEEANLPGSFVWYWWTGREYRERPAPRLADGESRPIGCALRAPPPPTPGWQPIDGRPVVW